MHFSKYIAYSAVSFAQNKNTDDTEKIVKLINKISQFKNIEKVKEFLKNTYYINEFVRKVQLCATGFLYIKETDKKYSLRISYINSDKENECVIYSFKK